MRPADRRALLCALGLAGLGLAVGPVATRLDPGLRVADAFLSWAATQHGTTRLFAHTTGRPLPPDPWGRPWARRQADRVRDAGALCVVQDPLAPGEPITAITAVASQSAVRWVVYSVGPDGVDDGGVRGPDVLLDLAPARRLWLVDLSPGCGLWLASLLLVSWAAGRLGGRWPPLRHAALVVVLVGGGAWLAVGRVEATLTWYQTRLEAPDGLPLVVPGGVAATLTLAALLALVAGLGRATTRATPPRPAPGEASPPDAPRPAPEPRPPAT